MPMALAVYGFHIWPLVKTLVLQCHGSNLGQGTWLWWNILR